MEISFANFLFLQHLKYTFSKKGHTDINVVFLEIVLELERHARKKTLICLI
jgi:hypothetical protein